VLFDVYRHTDRCGGGRGTRSISRRNDAVTGQHADETVDIDFDCVKWLLVFLLVYFRYNLAERIMCFINVSIKYNNIWLFAQCWYRLCTYC